MMGKVKPECRKWGAGRDRTCWRLRRVRAVAHGLPLIFFLAACGFHPLHARSGAGANAAMDLTAIQVTVNHSREGQLLEAEIKDAINPDGAYHEKLYALNATITRSETKLLINPDGTSSRSDIPVTSSYTLTRIHDGKLIDQGSITRITSYNTSNADYSSYVSLQDAQKRGVQELAQSYQLRLANIITNLSSDSRP